jgi:competence protein ComEA
MGAHAGSERPGRGRAGRHRRTGQALIDRRDHTENASSRRFSLQSLPFPPPSALIGIAVLVLIGAGVIHLSGSGTAVPLEEEDIVAAGEATPGTAGDDASPSTSDRSAVDDDPGDRSADDPVGNASDGTPPSTETDPSGGTPGTGTGAHEEGEEPAELIVHVSGAVQSPGVVRLASGARVDDALRAAGGITEEADLAAVNLARPVADGEQIHVPVPGEEPLPEGPVPGVAAPPEADGGAGGAGAGEGAASGAIDLNTADSAALEGLPGVGPAIAQRIVEHREKNGPFTSVDALLEVSGIGPATLEKIREKATV